MKNRKIKRLIAVSILAVTLLSGCSSNQQANRTTKDDVPQNIASYIIPPGSELPVLEFKEIWGYVVAGRESALTRDIPLTDVAYFSASVDAYGKLTEIPRRSGIPSFFTGKVHLVVICNGYGLSHFVLKPGTPERKQLINDLIAATRNFDGLNIDMENVPMLDGEDFASFLRELRQGLPKDKMLSLCVPARTRKLQTDSYDYDRLTPLVERVFVMAYDEHWSGSRPGSVASIGWCRNVADYSLRTIGKEKLVMGLPFYGRTWGDYSPSRALVYSSIEDVIRDNNVTNITYENGVPTFTYRKTVSVKVYYEDEYSLLTRMNMYKSMGINSIGFWRIGQETTEVWNYLKITSPGTPAVAAPITPIAPASSPVPAVSAVTPEITTVTTQAVNTSAELSSSFSGRHTVQRGESLWTISRRYGITMQSLADANGMKVNDTLYFGKVLRVPGQRAESSE